MAPHSTGCRGLRPPRPATRAARSSASAPLELLLLLFRLRGVRYALVSRFCPDDGRPGLFAPSERIDDQDRDLLRAVVEGDLGGERAVCLDGDGMPLDEDPAARLDLAAHRNGFLAGQLLGP